MITWKSSLAGGELEKQVEEWPEEAPDESEPFEGRFSILRRRRISSLARSSSVDSIDCLKSVDYFRDNNFVDRSDKVKAEKRWFR